MPTTGSAHKYATFASTYNVITIIVPNAIDSATSRLGFFTSAAVNPMLFQASAENSDPTCATPNATNNPNAPLAAVIFGTKPRRKSAPGSIGSAPRTAQKCEKLSLMAAALRPTNTQRKINPSSESVLALVKIFWIIFPSCTPSVFRNVKKMIISTATSCCTDKLMAYFDDNAIGCTTHVCGEIAGANTPRYRANPIATAAIVPVWITRNNVQPYKNPHNGENASRRYTYCPPACGNIAASSP